MSLMESLVAHPPPVREEQGVFRVGATRVRLDSVIGAFESGCSPEEILLKYPSLELTDIYAVITYYLWHRDEVDAYLEVRRRYSEQVEQENELRFPSHGIRERLLARRAQRP